MSDKRPVATDALETLGMLIDETAGRDAIHLAVEPVVAGEPLIAGQRITVRNGMAYRDDNGIGIVDPFLPHCGGTHHLHSGDRFWLIILPRQITSLRHVWTHPHFEREAALFEANKRAEAENWMRQYLDSHSDNPGFEAVYAAVKAKGGRVTVKGKYDDEEWGTSVYIDGDYLHVNGSDAHGEIDPEFWDKMEILTGERIHNRPTHFSCSC